MADVQPCEGFPDTCPYLLTVEPDPPRHDGGARCGCNARQDLEDMATELATGLGLVDPREYKATLDRYAAQIRAATPVTGKETVQADREKVLADWLSREYDLRGITELEQEDPERAQEHRDAAHSLVPWIDGCPREDRRAAWWRGYDQGRERQKRRTAEDVQRLEAETAELRAERDPEDLRARIRDLEHVLDGWNRRMTGRISPGEPVDWREQAAEYLLQLSAAQRELAILKGVQTDDATRRLAT